MNAVAQALVLSLLIADGAALRAVDPAWELIEIQGSTAKAGERSAPLTGSSRLLAELLGADRAAVRLVRVDAAADAQQVARFLGRLHQLGARQLALAFPDGEKEGMLPYCPAADATCLGRPWAGVRPVEKAKPAVTVAKGGALRLSLGDKAAAPVKLAELPAALEGVEDTHLRLEAEGVSWAELSAVIRANPLPAFTLAGGGPPALGGALRGFDQILGGLELGKLEMGEKRDQERKQISRAVRRGKVAGVDVDVAASEGPNVERSGPVKLELSVDEDYAGESLPAEFLRGVADTLKAGAPPVDACYLAEKKKQPSLAGQLDVLFRVGAGGKVLSAKVKRDRLSSPPVKKCVLDVLRGLSFPPPPKGRESVVLSNRYFFK